MVLLLVLWCFPNTEVVLELLASGMQRTNLGDRGKPTYPGLLQS